MTSKNQYKEVFVKLLERVIRECSIIKSCHGVLTVDDVKGRLERWSEIAMEELNAGVESNRLLANSVIKNYPTLFNRATEAVFEQQRLEPLQNQIEELKQQLRDKDLDVSEMLTIAHMQGADSCRPAIKKLIADLEERDAKIARLEQCLQSVAFFKDDEPAVY